MDPRFSQVDMFCIKKTNIVDRTNNKLFKKYRNFSENNITCIFYVILWLPFESDDGYANEMFVALLYFDGVAYLLYLCSVFRGVTVNCRRRVRNFSTWGGFTAHIDVTYCE